MLYVFRSSSVVERLPVKEDVVGSIPTSGAKYRNPFRLFCALICLWYNLTNKQKT